MKRNIFRKNIAGLALGLGIFLSPLLAEDQCQCLLERDEEGALIKIDLVSPENIKNCGDLNEKAVIVFRSEDKPTVHSNLLECSGNSEFSSLEPAKENIHCRSAVFMGGDLICRAGS